MVQIRLVAESATNPFPEILPLLPCSCEELVPDAGNQMDQFKGFRCCKNSPQVFFEVPKVDTVLPLDLF